MEFWKSIFQSQSKSPNNQKQSSGNTNANSKTVLVTSDLASNLAYIQQALFQTDDLQTRTFTKKGTTAQLIYLEGICDPNIIKTDIINRLLKADQIDTPEDIVTTLKFKYETNIEQLISHLLRGFALFFIEGSSQGYAFAAVAALARTPEEPPNEKVIYGAHTGFIEDLNTNLQLIRKTIHNRDLTVRYYQVGSTTDTKIAVMYMGNTACPKIVKEIENRIQSIQMKDIIPGNIIHEIIEDNPYSPFPQILTTERADRSCANLIEGRVIIFVEGTACAFVLPVSFFSFYQSTDDYAIRWIPATFIRLLRFFSFLIAILLPAFYIAVTSFHSEIIPEGLFTVVKANLLRIPFAPIVEALFLEFTIELVREAGIRLPGPISSTIGIVGGLVIGESVVNAGFVSSVMIVVVAMTALATYVVPNHEMSISIRVIRFPIMFMASLFGFIGIVAIVLILLIHLCKLEPLGRPYLFPLSPMRIKNFLDTFIRAPIQAVQQLPNDVQEKPPSTNTKEDQS
ncbi:spore germination protein [Paenibacillus sp. N1-5-1-14]|uniref:spore germination protein n=1 Tax=Paenibacillus radicibacter TaxID=2972488 RepID=UPI00215987F0|nr:spore germination protein [Paenibacillus radicibacter]MCR8643154.1 spore germination protein [Paenibacillus radicibacter]